MSNFLKFYEFLLVTRQFWFRKNWLAHGHTGWDFANLLNHRCERLPRQKILLDIDLVEFATLKRLIGVFGRFQRVRRAVIEKVLLRNGIYRIVLNVMGSGVVCAVLVELSGVLPLGDGHGFVAIHRVSSFWVAWRPFITVVLVYFHVSSEHVFLGEGLADKRGGLFVWVGYWDEFFFGVIFVLFNLLFNRQLFFT